MKRQEILEIIVSNPQAIFKNANREAGKYSEFATYFQVIGVSGKNSFSHLTPLLQGKRVLVIPDPQGEKEAVELARSVQGTVFEPPVKIDDWIIACDLKGDNLYNILRQGRKV